MIAASILLVLASASTTSAGDPSLAVRGLDPVRLCEGAEVPGREDLEATQGRFSYRFCDAATRARFLAEPERWGIQWGGGCGRMGPLSGVGSPDRWAVHAGRIYVFASDGCRRGFLAAPQRFVVPPVAVPAGSAAAREAGATWIARAVEAHGGAAAIDAADGLHLESEREAAACAQRLEQDLGRDGGLTRHRVWIPEEPDTPGYEQTWSLGARSVVDDDGEVFPLTSPDQLEDLRRFAHREPLIHLWARGDAEFLALDLGAGELDAPGTARTVENVIVRHRGLATTLHLDPVSGRVVGLSWRGRPNDGITADVVEVFSAWREVDGVLLPVDRSVSVDGELEPALAVAWDAVALHARAPRPAAAGGAR